MLCAHLDLSDEAAAPLSVTAPHRCPPFIRTSTQPPPCATPAFANGRWWIRVRRPNRPERLVRRKGRAGRGVAGVRPDKSDTGPWTAPCSVETARAVSCPWRAGEGLGGAQARPDFAFKARSVAPLVTAKGAKARGRLGCSAGLRSATVVSAPGREPVAGARMLGDEAVAGGGERVTHRALAQAGVVEARGEQARPGACAGVVVGLDQGDHADARDAREGVKRARGLDDEESERDEHGVLGGGHAADVDEADRLVGVEGVEWGAAAMSGARRPARARAADWRRPEASRRRLRCGARKPAAGATRRQRHGGRASGPCRAWRIARAAPATAMVASTVSGCVMPGPASRMALASRSAGPMVPGAWWNGVLLCMGGLSCGK